MGSGSNANRFDMLKTVQWSSRFSDEENQVISSFLQVREHKKGEAVFLQGDPGDFMCFLVKGSVGIAKDISDTRDTIVVTIHPGNHFGELSFADAEPRSASAVANEDVVVLTLSISDFETLAKDNPELGMKILKHMLQLVSKRLRMTTRELVYRV
ncbi:MAG: cyclic nucleotide-binding domain-containing protein [Desulfovibrio sp.]|nr:MAG: cyclic nucleotide-binding domain-containing protein [Desulfovibrio sp.]